MTSADDAHIWHLNKGEGLSIRQIAKRLGINRGVVFRALRRHAAVMADDDDGSVMVFTPELVPPFVFVGAEWVAMQAHEHDDPVPGLEVRFVDSRLTSCSWMQIYQWYAECDDDVVVESVAADVRRQLIEAGVMLGQELSGVWVWAPAYREPPSSLRAV
jgi:hypothetical protein